MSTDKLEFNTHEVEVKRNSLKQFHLNVHINII